MPTGFAETFGKLRDMIAEETAGMEVTSDHPKGFMVTTGFSPRWKKEIFFGGVRIGKSYVSYYLFPVYMVPALASDLSPGLKKRMQGKSCFNFKAVDETLLSELRGLTRRCREAFRDGRLETAAVAIEAPRKRPPAKKAVKKAGRS
jgi:hypothetical protein